MELETEISMDVLAISDSAMPLAQGLSTPGTPNEEIRVHMLPSLELAFARTYERGTSDHAWTGNGGSLMILHGMQQDTKYCERLCVSTQQTLGSVQLSPAYTHVVFSAHGDYVACTAARSSVVEILSSATGRLLLRFEGCFERNFRWHPRSDDQIAAFSKDPCSVHIFSVSRQAVSLTQTVPVSSGQMISDWLDDCNGPVISGADHLGKPVLFIACSSKLVQCPHPGGLQRLSISPNGRFAVVSSMSRKGSGHIIDAIVFDAETGKEHFRVSETVARGTWERFYSTWSSNSKHLYLSLVSHSTVSQGFLIVDALTWTASPWLGTRGIQRVAGQLVPLPDCCRFLWPHASAVDGVRVPTWVTSRALINFDV